ncbi:putative inorganic phosphate cotransporter isoform X2 [Anticarsia gemmatalis]|uniref:putative inorganic phosphate cotransporter isoform X2 n=1 Tax=Anticarsia gemmatalis TaxID=129554 RepID=UPI003F768199
MNTEEGVKDAASLKPKKLLGIRHFQVVMLFFAMVLAFSMRVNMSMAIVAMTDKDSENTFDWSMQTQSVILSSFFWGYVVLQIPAGEIAAKFGGSLLITVVVAGNAAISLLIPLAAYYGGWQSLCACRVFQGLTQGFLFPTMHNLIGKWVPLEEKSRLGTLIYAGSQLGTALQLLASGFIASYWGWPAIFYVNGALGAIWTCVYVVFGADSPEKSRMISAEEKLYIQTSLGQVGEQKKLQTPWKAIFTSLPFFALVIAHCGQNWGFWTLMTEMPSYMKQILGVDIKANGAMSALPYLSMYLLGFPFGFISDYVLKKKWLSTSACRKISNSIGMWGPAVALVGLSYVPAGQVGLAVGLLTIVVGLNAGHYTGFLIVHIDMAPNYAGTMMGITNMFANIISIISPLVAGLILQDEADPNQWRHVFYLSSAIYIAANLFFVIFGSCETQTWNKPNEVEDNNGTEKKAEKVV